MTDEKKEPTAEEIEINITVRVLEKCKAELMRVYKAQVSQIDAAIELLDIYLPVLTDKDSLQIFVKRIIEPPAAATEAPVQKQEAPVPATPADMVPQEPQQGNNREEKDTERSNVTVKPRKEPKPPKAPKTNVTRLPQVGESFVAWHIVQGLLRWADNGQTFLCVSVEKHQCLVHEGQAHLTIDTDANRVFCAEEWSFDVDSKTTNFAPARAEISPTMSTKGGDAE